MRSHAPAALLTLAAVLACDTSGAPLSVEFDARNDLAARIFRPAGPGPHPGVILLHGGCFLHGSRDGLVAEARELARSGLVAMTVDYRHADAGGQFPGALGDVKCAVRWLKSHAGELDVDPSRIGVYGTSAGGYLAAMTAATAGLDAYDRVECGPGVDATVAAAVVLAGVSDWRTRCRSRMRTCEEIFLGATCDPRDLAPIFTEASVVTYRDRVAVPHLLLHAANDQDIPIDQSLLLRAALRSIGVDVEFHAFPDVGHGFERDFESASARQAREITARFLLDRLR